jgi:hypothetical protein
MDGLELHALLSTDEQITQYLEDNLASEDPQRFLLALVNVAEVRGIKAPPFQALGSWVAVHALLRELDFEGLYVRFVTDTLIVRNEGLALVAGGHNH